MELANDLQILPILLTIKHSNSIKTWTAKLFGSKYRSSLKHSLQKKYALLNQTFHYHLPGIFYCNFISWSLLLSVKKNIILWLNSYCRKASVLVAFDWEGVKSKDCHGQHCSHAGLSPSQTLTTTFVVHWLQTLFNLKLQSCLERITTTKLKTMAM